MSYKSPDERIEELLSRADALALSVSETSSNEVLQKATDEMDLILEELNQLLAETDQEDNN